MQTISLISICLYSLKTIISVKSIIETIFFISFACQFLSQDTNVFTIPRYQTFMLYLHFYFLEAAQKVAPRICRPVLENSRQCCRHQAALSPSPSTNILYIYQLRHRPPLSLLQLQIDCDCSKLQSTEN